MLCADHVAPELVVESITGNVAPVVVTLELLATSVARQVDTEKHTIDVTLATLAGVLSGVHVPPPFDVE
jgi:hypothetical protein